MFRSLVIAVALPALTTLAGTAPTQALGDPIPSTYTLIGSPLTLVPPIGDLPPALPSSIILQVSLNPYPLPQSPDPSSGLNLGDPTQPVYSYPNPDYIETSEFDFGFEQTGNSPSGAAGAGKTSFTPFQTTSSTGDTSDGTFNLVGADGAVLETFNVEFEGIDPSSLQAAIPNPLPCDIACAVETFSFYSAALPDPSVTFSVASGSTTFSFSETPVPAALPLFATGLGALGLLSWRRKRKAQALARVP